MVTSSGVDASIAYFNGQWLPLSQCHVPINTHALQYGTGVFEGIRAYWDGTRIRVLFLKAHVRRLARSAHTLLMGAPTVDEIAAIVLECVRRNAPATNTYIRPLIYKSGTTLGPVLVNVPDGFLCYQQPLGDYIDTSKGLALCVSSWRRLPDSCIPSRAKTTASYLNSALAKSEAVLNGFDEAVFLNDRGQVCEGSAENIFIVRDGALITPDRTADALEGITRGGVIGLAADLGIPVIERPVGRTELYQADEVFLVGTGCQVSYARSIDHRTVGDGSRGPVTTRIQKAYEDTVYGRGPRSSEWLTGIA